MTKDDIVNWAHKAGFLIDTHAQQYQPNCILSTHGLIDENLQRFANLVAAHKAEPPPEWPLVKNILDEYGLDAIAFVAEWKAAQQQAEPVAWRYRGNLHEFDPSDWAEGPVTPLYTTPPQRTWVGLTDAERRECTQFPFSEMNHRAIEAKLKEKT